MRVAFADSAPRMMSTETGNDQILRDFCVSLSRTGWSVSLLAMSSRSAYIASLSRARDSSQPLLIESMSLTPHPRKEWAHRGNKGSPHSLAESALSRAASQYPCDVDPQGSTRTHTSSASVPPTFLQHLALLAAGVVWTSLSEPSQQVSLHPRKLLFI